jgi:hypothetical protein
MLDMEQMKIHTPSDWGSFAWAAEQLDVSVRQIARYVQAGTLTAYTPRIGARETKRHKRMVSVDDVQALKRARLVVGRG